MEIDRQNPLSPLLKPEAVAEFLGTSVRNVHALVRQGKLACVQISAKERRFLPEHITDFIESRIVVKPKSSVDRRTMNSLPSLSKSIKGGRKESGNSIRAQLNEEMRLW